VGSVAQPISGPRDVFPSRQRTLSPKIDAPAPATPEPVAPAPVTPEQWAREPSFAATALAAYPLLVWLPIPIDLALFALVGLGAAAVLLEQPPSFPGGWPFPDLLLLVYLCGSALSVALAPDLPRALALSSALLPRAFLYVLASRYLVSTRQIGLVSAGLVAAGISIASFVLVVGAANRSADQSATRLVEAVASPILIVPNDVLWIACMIPIAASTLLRPRLGPASALALLSLLGMSTAIVALQSRAALLGALLGIAAVFAASLRVRGRLGLLLAGVAVVISAVLATDALLGFPLTEKFASLCFTRGPFWSAAWALFVERPWLGHGAHSFVDLYEARLPTEPALFCEQLETRITPWPHNLFLELLATQGLIGTIPITLALGWGLLTSFRLSHHHSASVGVLASGLLGAWTVFLFGAVFELSLLRLWVVTTFALLLGLTVALRAISQGEGPTALA
jgi:O-antigen ligase